MKQELREGSDLAVYQFAEDFVRETLLSPLTKAHLRGHGKHYPFALASECGFTKVPGVSFFMSLASKVDADLLDFLLQAFPTFNQELKVWMPMAAARAKFYTFLFKFAWTLFVVKDVKFFWSSQVGFGVKAAVNMARNTVVNSCWGLPVLVTDEQFELRKVLGSHLLKSYLDCCVAGTNQRYAFFGPLAFVNFSCKRCVTVAFSDRCSKRALSYPFDGKPQKNSFSSCTVMCQLFVDDELLLCYKPLLSSLQCAHPGHTCLTSFTCTAPQSEINN